MRLWRAARRCAQARSEREGAARRYGATAQQRARQPRERDRQRARAPQSALSKMLRAVDYSAAARCVMRVMLLRYDAGTRRRVLCRGNIADVIRHKMMPARAIRRAPRRVIVRCAMRGQAISDMRRASSALARARASAAHAAMSAHACSSDYLS